MQPRKPAVSNLISIDSAAQGPEPQPPIPASARQSRKSSGDYSGRRRQALRLFFLMGSGVWKVHRQMNVGTREIERELRELGFAEWERKYGNRRAA